MAVAIGARIGPYEIVAPLGAGGMGEVYRARDTKLNREVALKVLPDIFASDQDRIARFQREAELLATLNHPNIAAIFGLEDSNGTRALAMELVDGETLADRIAQGPVPIVEALPLARQLGDALDYAHEHGVLHRDLKPANIKVTPDGQVKVLDFGLAKALSTVTSGAPGSSAHDFATITSPALTQAGVLMGTASYMSPEQSRGKPADKRADIWAFGCVLFEMLSGRRPFDGDTVADVLAAIVTREPDFSSLPETTPPRVRELIRRCLHKDRRDRLRDIGDARLELDASLSGTDSQYNGFSRSRFQRTLPWGIASLGLLFGLAMLVRDLQPSVSNARIIRIDAQLDSDASLATDLGPAAILSPDGSVLAFVARRSGQARQLYVRRLEQLQNNALSGTEDARNPFFSPDGQWIGFFASGKLKKVPVVGGTVVIVCDAPNGRGAVWDEDGRIIFNPSSAGGVSLQRVSAAGGTPETLVTLEVGEATQRWPQVLPGGRAVLYTTSKNLGNYNDGDIVVQPLPSGSRKILVRGGYFGRYLPSGHLSYVHDRRLFVAAIDIERLELAGAPVPVLESVFGNTTIGAAQFAFSNSGTVVYVPGGSAGWTQPILWLNRDGTTTTLRSTVTDWSNVRFSPDGRRLAMDIFDGKQTDIWVYEWARETLTPLTIRSCRRLDAYMDAGWSANRFSIGA
jgi:serine/threonine protein kinase